MTFSKLNISIRWKMLGGFIISALVPSLLAFAGTEPLTILIISLTVASFLAVLAILRVMRTLKKVQSHLAPDGLLGSRELDELRLIDESLNHFEQYLEKKHEEEFESTRQVEVKPTVVLEDVYKANLLTGDPVFAEVKEIPRRRSVELVSSAKLAGAEAKIVLKKAIEKVLDNLEKLKAYEGLNDDEKGILDFQIMILHDPAFMMEVDKLIDLGNNLLSIITRVFEKYREQLESSDDLYMRERAVDFNDLKQRLIEAIHDSSGHHVENRFKSLEGKIAISKHILPSEVISLHNAGVAGIISLENTPSSHAQILLSSLNISSLSSLKELPLEKMSGHKVLLDTMKGQLLLEPSPAKVEQVMTEYACRKSDVIVDKVILSNGEEFKIGVTINNPQVETAHAVEASPDFVGLFRTEMHFIGQKKLPTEEELVHTYRWYLC